MLTLTHDFETRSACDIRKSGGWRYAEDESTEIMCLAFTLPDGEVYVWNPAYQSVDIPERNRDKLEEFHQHVRDGCLLEAHNVQFERAIWKFVATAKMGWPEVNPEQWRCSAALAASHGLPRDLDRSVKALELDVEKDMVGNRIMKKISKPRGCLKADLSLVADHLWSDPSRWKEVDKPKNVYILKEKYPEVCKDLNPWHEKVEELEHLFEYCGKDVEAERALSDKLGHDLDPYEFKIWQLDQKMNSRGVQIDVDLVDAAIDITEECKIDSDARLAYITGGEIKSASQRDALLAWINDQPCEGVLENMQKDHLAEMAKEKHLWTPEAQEAINIRLSQAKTSTSKYLSMRSAVNSDGRARGLIAYYGANTGRFAGRIIQPHNMPRGSVEGSMVDLCDAIKTKDRDHIDLLYGDPMEAMSSAIRGAIIAGADYDLICSDYSSVEARGTFWLTDDFDALNILRAGKDIYKEMAAQVFGVKYDQVTKYQRFLGKQAILGLGYQMGAERYVRTCADYGVEITLELAERIVTTYRKTHYKVTKFWKQIEEAAKRSVTIPNIEVKLGKLTFITENDFLKIRLPSGRCVHYYKPQVEELWSKRFENWRMKLTFMGIDTYSKQYMRLSTYGGMLTENVIQALCRDILCEAMIRLDASGVYIPILTIHDEIVSEVKKGQGSVEQYNEILSELPWWAGGFPIEAEGWVGPVYHK